MVVSATEITKGASKAVPKRSTAGKLLRRVKVVLADNDVFSCTNIVRKNDPMSCDNKKIKKLVLDLVEELPATLVVPAIFLNMRFTAKRSALTLLIIIAPIETTEICLA